MMVIIIYLPVNISEIGEILLKYDIQTRFGGGSFFRFIDVLGFSVQRRRLTHFKIQEEHPIHHFSCHIVFVQRMTTSELKNHN